jgi:hypothetical protein
MRGTLCAHKSDVLHIHGKSFWIVTNTITHMEYVSGHQPVAEVPTAAKFASRAGGPLVLPLQIPLENRAHRTSLNDSFC